LKENRFHDEKPVSQCDLTKPKVDEHVSKKNEPFFFFEKPVLFFGKKPVFLQNGSQNTLHMGPGSESGLKNRFAHLHKKMADIFISLERLELG
jgi:hypothetical protein